MFNEVTKQAFITPILGIILGQLCSGIDSMPRNRLLFILIIVAVHTGLKSAPAFNPD